MNSLLYMPPDVATTYPHTDALVYDENATVPMACVGTDALVSTSPLQNSTLLQAGGWNTMGFDEEDELHTSFEQAISERVVSIRARLHRISEPSLQAVRSPHTPHTSALSMPVNEMNVNMVTQPGEAIVAPAQERDGERAKWLLLCCTMGLMLLLLGFDLMGLLVLYLR